MKNEDSLKRLRCRATSMKQGVHPASFAGNREKDGEGSTGLFSYGRDRLCFVLSHFSRFWLFAALQVALSLGFSGQEYWVGSHVPLPGDISDSGIEPMSLPPQALVGGFFTTSATWEAPLLQKCASFIYVPVRIEDSSWLPTTHTHTHTPTTHTSVACSPPNSRPAYVTEINSND